MWRTAKSAPEWTGSDFQAVIGAAAVVVMVFLSVSLLTQ